MRYKDVQDILTISPFNPLGPIRPGNPGRPCEAVEIQNYNTLYVAKLQSLDIHNAISRIQQNCFWSHNKIIYNSHLKNLLLQVILK